MYYLLLIFLLFRIEKVYSFSKKELFENINLYTNELCSYNGIPKIENEANEVICECNERYANEPRKNNIKYINGHIIQCSYKRKSRFFTIFLTLCIPLGFDFLYLKRPIAFTFSLLGSLITIGLSVLLFIMNYRINLKTKESKIQIRLNKMANKSNEQKKIEDGKSYKYLVLLCEIFVFAHICYTIIVFILHILGKIPDGNNVETENDLGYLFTNPD